MLSLHIKAGHGSAPLTDLRMRQNMTKQAAVYKGQPVTEQCLWASDSCPQQSQGRQSTGWDISTGVASDGYHSTGEDRLGRCPVPFPVAGTLSTTVSGSGLTHSRVSPVSWGDTLVVFLLRHKQTLTPWSPLACGQCPPAGACGSRWLLLVLEQLTVLGSQGFSDFKSTVWY